LGVQGVRELVVQVPDAGHEAVVGRPLVHDRVHEVVRGGRIAGERDAAVVGVHSVDRSGVRLVIRARGEDGQHEALVVLAGYRAVVVHQGVKVRVLTQDARTDGTG